MKNPKKWEPAYRITPAIARALMEIEAAKAVVETTPLPPAVEAQLRHQARLRSTHYSTRIEGNRLSLKEAEAVIDRKKTRFHGRERDVGEVRHYWEALLRVEQWATRKSKLTKHLIQTLHAIVERGRRAKPTPYRAGQNAIRESGSGALVYLPPEARDVRPLMAGLVRWVEQAQKKDAPIPILAALVHYQFVTIHPHYDGNGRTARLLATFILHRGGYGLHGFFSMEEHHAKDLEGYYRSLATHPHHNYYHGRTEADLTPWVEYFVALLAKVFSQAKEVATASARRGVPVEPRLLKTLDRRARMVLALFAKQDTISARDVKAALGLSERMVRLLLKTWTGNGWLVVADPSNRKRSYRLSAIYRKFIGNPLES